MILRRALYARHSSDQQAAGLQRGPVPGLPRARGARGLEDRRRLPFVLNPTLAAMHLHVVGEFFQRRSVYDGYQNDRRIGEPPQRSKAP